MTTLFGVGFCERSDLFGKLFHSLGENDKVVMLVLFAVASSWISRRGRVVITRVGGGVVRARSTYYSVMVITRDVHFLLVVRGESINTISFSYFWM